MNAIAGIDTHALFGWAAHRISARDYAQERAAAVSTTGWHVMSVGQLAIVPFDVYRQTSLGFRTARRITSPAGVLDWIGAGIMIAALVPRVRAERRARKAAGAAL